MVTPPAKSSLHLDKKMHKIQEGGKLEWGMELRPHVDIIARVHAEVKALPREIRLVGNATLQAIARELLKGEQIEITEFGTPVHLMSMEQYGALFLSAFLEEIDLLQGHYFFISIPELELQLFAEHHGIAWLEEPKNDVRIMLDNIAQEQPQTYFSLLRSAQRLQAILRNGKENSLKSP